MLFRLFIPELGDGWIISANGHIFAEKYMLTNNHYLYMVGTCMIQTAFPSRHWTLAWWFSSSWRSLIIQDLGFVHDCHFEVICGSLLVTLPHFSGLAIMVSAHRRLATFGVFSLFLVYFESIFLLFVIDWDDGNILPTQSSLILEYYLTIWLWALRTSTRGCPLPE